MTGVPQGSILSVTLFSLKINSIVSCLLPDIECSLYVDDLAIYYSSSHMPSIERKLQHSLNRLGRWCDENGFKFSPIKTMCVHFCQLRKHNLDPQIYLNGTQIPTIGEAKFLGLIFDSKLSLIPHITSLKSRCTKSLDLIKVLSNTPWGADRKVLLRLYRALIRSKLYYGCNVFGSARPSYIKRLDTVHNQGLRLCLGAFRTSPVQSLYVEANEPPLDMRRTCLSLQYGVKLMSNEVNPAFSAVFQSDIVATDEAKERAIKWLSWKLQALLSKWVHPTVQTIMRFLVFLHTVHKTVIFCWLPSHMGISGNKRADSAAKAALQKDVSNCLISYTDTYQYISQYVRDMWQREWDSKDVVLF